MTTTTLCVCVLAQRRKEGIERRPTQDGERGRNNICVRGATRTRLVWWRRRSTDVLKEECGPALSLSLSLFSVEEVVASSPPIAANIFLREHCCERPHNNARGPIDVTHKYSSFLCLYRDLFAEDNFDDPLSLLRQQTLSRLASSMSPIELFREAAYLFAFVWHRLFRDAGQVHPFDWLI